MDNERKTDAIHVFWQPGCTSCLRTKEFLTKHGVAFVSRNVLEDGAAFDDLAKLGLQQVPIVARGNEWVDGQVLTDVARLTGIEFGGMKMLSVPELETRLRSILAGAERFLNQLPDGQLKTLQPDRPRSYEDLVYHIFNIADAFLEHEAGIPLTFDSYNRYTVPETQGKGPLTAYGRDVQDRLNAWFAGDGKKADWNAQANVYYGKQTLHEFLERTTWHSGQHLRQLMWALDGLGIKVDRPLGAETFAGLPMPEKVWEGEGLAA